MCWSKDSEKMSTSLMQTIAWEDKGDQVVTVFS